MLQNILSAFLAFCELLFAASIIIVRVVDPDKSREFFSDKKVLAFLWVLFTVVGALVFIFQIFSH